MGKPKPDKEAKGRTTGQTQPRSRSSFSPLPDQGLTEEQAARRREQGQGNRPVQAPSKTVGQIVRGNVFTFFNLIFFVLGACVIAVGSFKNLLFLLVVIANTLIGILQEIRAKRVIDRLTLLTAPKAAVVREGTVRTVNTEELVLDDVVRFAPGNQVCADAVVLQGTVQVNRSPHHGDIPSPGAGDLLLSAAFSPDARRGWKPRTRRPPHGGGQKGGRRRESGMMRS